MKTATTSITLFLFLAGASLLSLLLTCTLPVDPTGDPKNAGVSLLINNKHVDFGSIVVNQGESREIGLEISLAKHFEKIILSSSCGIIDRNIVPDASTEHDTIPFTLNFATAGACSIYVKATFRESIYKDKTDTLVFMVLAGKPTIELLPISSNIITHVGKIDTLIFISQSTGGPLSPTFTVAAVPVMDNTHFYPIVSPTDDTVRVVFIPSVAETCTIMLKAALTYSNTGTIIDAAFVGVRVYASLAPVAVDAPQTVAAGTADTLTFTVDNSTRPDTLSIGLCNQNSLPASIFTVIPTGKDTLRIAVFPATTVATGSFAIGIRTETVQFSDTTWFPLTFVDKSSSFWNKTDTSVSAIEGTAFQLDLRPFLNSPHPGSINFTASVGTISSDTLWKWTPAWGRITPETTIMTAKNSDAAQNLKLLINVTPGDTTKPTIRLLDNALNGKKIGSPQLTVECVVNDRQAGPGRVTIAFGAQIVEATVRNDSVYSAAITGLTHGAAAQISIAAFDKSIRQNMATLTFTVTYDSTISDAEPPIFSYVSGSNNNDRVKTAGGTCVFAIADNSGVDSVWWTLNGSFADTCAQGASGKYTLNYSLLAYGKNTIKIYAIDGSPQHNKGSVEILLNYNTSLTPVVNGSPARDTTTISTEPTFTWTGGDDADGDTVYSAVLYGIASGSLLPTSETKGKSLTLPAASRLIGNRPYVWQVFSYTKTPFSDTVKSVLTTFTTIGTAPQITAQPTPTLSIIEGQPLTLTVTVSGNPTPKCQWYKNNQLLPGDTATTFTKSTSIPADSGSYHVTASNGIGSEAVSNKSVVTVRIIAKIIEDPISITAKEDSSATFIVKTAGEAPLSYQWLRDGQIITNGTTTTYTMPTVTTADHNKKFRCIVANALGKDTSNEALLTVTAAPRCTVTFAMDGGLPAATQQILKSGLKAAKPATDPTKAGYVFSGWHPSSTATTEFDFTAAITASRTIYAKWVPVYTVTYHENGGTGSVPVDSKKYRSTELATVLDKPAGLIWNGHDFVGWTMSDAGTGAVYTVGMTITIGSAGVDLFAKWQLSTPPPVITTPLADKTCPVNEFVTFTVAATGLNLSFEWRKNGTKIDGATSTNFTTSALTATDVAVPITYSCMVSNTGGTVTSSATLSVSTLTDVDGNMYHQVKIGVQVWTIENLRVTKYNDGTTAVPLDTSTATWNGATTPKFCYFGNMTNADSIKMFGALYNWYVVSPTNPSKITPAGWHVPTDAEWDILQNYLIANGYNYDGTQAGNKIAKAMATKTDWEPSEAAGAIGNDLTINNRSGFSAMPGGYRVDYGVFDNIGGYNHLWTATETDGLNASVRYLDFGQPDLLKYGNWKSCGFSVRLVKD